MGPEEKQLLETLNNTTQPLPETTVVELVETQISHTPDSIAVVQGEASITYRELNLRANRLAHYLIKKGVGPESLAGIALERSLEMVIAILATWKAGAAYLPLDPDYPRARLQFMLEDARPAVVITSEQIRQQLPLNASNEFVILDQADIQTELNQAPDHNPALKLLPQNTAYVIYTSGSTGKPKGVVVSHVGIPSLALSHTQRLELVQNSRVLQFASLNFDASFWELLMALTTGSALVLTEDEQGGFPLQELLKNQRITHATLTPSVLSTLDERQDAGPPNLIIVGEKCPGDLVARWSQGRRVVNAYGPTEITVCATISSPLSSSALPPIGSPIANTKVYVLNDHLHPLPMGVPGELYIANAGLARGYLNQPALTAERFVANPFSEDAGSRMYRTGDIVRWRHDGNLEFLGRADEQVKVRGFRIELGEIEAALQVLPEVTGCAAVLHEDEQQEKQIVAYIVAKDRAHTDPVALRRTLSERLPAHMVPSTIVRLENLPLTPSGK
ncbi:MAG TPA: amino acid adenylation domain-containing protein, partial [Candidatus Sulfotelmatobacter sp.]|nr:amino acid adenylation domain-containing protein [Candidatus Sulfotelmatobacter sp.]